MERHFILPMFLAATLHVGLLFGFRTPHVNANPILTKYIRAETETPIIEVINPETVADSDATPPETSTTQWVSSPEPPPLQNRDIQAIQFPAETFLHTIGPVTVASIGLFPPRSSLGDQGGGISGVVSRAQLDAAPHVRFQAQPAYPFEAKRDGRRGEVLVEFIVDESGRVMAPRVVRSSDRIFEEPTLRAVSKWRFEPGTSQGRIVRFHMSVPVVFNLSED